MTEWGQADIDDFVASLHVTPDAPGFYLVPCGTLRGFLLELVRLRNGAPPDGPRPRRVEPVEHTCPECDTPFTRPGAHTTPGKAGPFCGRPCASQYANRRRWADP